MWQMRVQDPSGEERIVMLGGTAWSAGRNSESEIVLRDPSAPPVAARFSVIRDRVKTESVWMSVPTQGPPPRLGDVKIREAELPPGLPLIIGESRLVLEAASSGAQSRKLPEFPAHRRPWLTQSEEGARVLWLTRKAAGTPLSIYLAGETGTGKEVLAHLIHAWSDRASGPFVPLHCGSLSPHLAESELFGHVKGAYTGAHQARAGALLQAHGGTLFLDEVGDLPPEMQVKLLRFLEDGEIRPVGSDKVLHAQARILCATHLPLLKMVEEGRFRRDLYYRLASVTIEIPPLRARPEDVELLAGRFASDLSRTLTPGALRRLMSHAWPGNVRELRHAIERGAGLAGPYCELLTEDAFEFLLRPENVREAPELELGLPVLSLDEMERVLLIRALRLARGNRSEAARILGVARSTLFTMIRRHKIVGPKSRL